MSWEEHYKSNTISKEEAASKIKSGDQVILTHANGEPGLVINALGKRQNEVEGVRIWHGISFGPGHHVAEDINPESIQLECIFVGPATRKAANEGRALVTPMHFSDAPNNIRTGLVKCDVALMHVSKPDAFGYVSLGVSVDFELAAIEKANTVIAEVNENMPRTFGKGIIHVSEIDYFVQSSEPLITIGESVIGEKEELIGKNIAALIKDGSCLQIGVGAMPDAVMKFIADKNDLGIHTEMMTTGTMNLIKSGVANGKCKNINKGIAVSTFAGGTKELYEWLHENPQVEFYPVDYVNDGNIIKQNDNMISINSALQVDMMGQVTAEAIGPKQYSGVGGQMDFVRGATWSKGGKSFIALTSTARKGTVSRITAALAPGTPVTTPRNDVDNIVTEYGVAALRGQPIVERARRLIAIAHPDFRDELKDDFERVYELKL